jgi:hypothetical protein
MSMVGHYLVVTASELEKLYSDPDSVEKFLFEEKDYDGVYIDKAWHAIHFTLTGSVWDGDPPLANVVMGGEPIGEDLGWGPARVLSVNQVADAYLALEDIPVSKFRTMCNVGMLEKNDIYPSIWHEGESAVDYVAYNYKLVVDVFKEASEKKCALVVFRS